MRIKRIFSIGKKVCFDVFLAILGIIILAIFFVGLIVSLIDGCQGQ